MTNNKYLFFILLRIKRLTYLIKKIIRLIQSGLVWYFKSKEHTSFSFKVSNKTKTMLRENLSADFSFPKSQIINTINFLENINLVEKKTKKFKFNIMDVDFNSNYDYRILPLLFSNILEIQNIVEMGFNQGRTPYILSEFKKSYKDFNFQYYGVDVNKRKGGLLLDFYPELNDNVKIFFKDVSDFLDKNVEKKFLENSILVSSTHEAISEKAIFDYLKLNQIYPKIIISDNVRDDSSYFKFLSDSEFYSSKVYIFTDINKFQDPLHIGVATFLT